MTQNAEPQNIQPFKLRLHDKSEACQLLRPEGQAMHPRTLERLMRRGEISYRRVGGRILFSDCDIAEYLEASRHPARVAA